MRGRLRAGFTLIELLVVVSILAILIVMAIPQFFANYRVKALDAAAKTSLSRLAVAQENYYVDFSTYTASRASLATVSGWTVEDTVAVTIAGASQNSWSATARHTSSPNTYTYSSTVGGLVD